MERTTFLTPEEVAELTGILTGKRVHGKPFTREQLQVNWLRSEGIPFFENARGRPIIARTVIEGGYKPPSSHQEKKTASWQPKAIQGRS